MSAWYTVEVIRNTGKAVLVTDSKTEAWLPSSQIIDEEDELLEGRTTKIELPDWLAEDRGLA